MTGQPLPRRIAPAIAALAAAMLCACSTADKTSFDQAERLEAAMARQQADQEKPAADNRLVYLDMIRTMQERSLYFASLAHIDAYRRLHGDAPDILRLRADALRETGQQDEAERQYRQLLDTPEAAAVWHGLGLLAAQRGDYAHAIANLRESVRRDPINAVVLGDLGYALLQDGDLAAARLPLIQAAELAPDNRRIVGNLALYLLRSGERDKAEAMMAQAGLPQDVRAEIMRRAQAAPSAQAAPTLAAAAAASDGMRLQMQRQLLAPEKRSQHAE